MRVAIPHWQGRVSPVLDVAGVLLLAEVDRGVITGRQDVPVEEERIQERAGRIRELGVDVLICGAVSWPLEMALVSAGIEVVAQTCGDVEEVLNAFLAGRLLPAAFLMPGCRGRRRRFRGGRRSGGRIR